MLTQILMPALSPTMEDGTIAKWLVKEGDEVVAGDLLAEIETDKAIMEFEAVDDGVISKILIPEGTSGVKVNEPIAIIQGDGGDGALPETPPFARQAGPLPDLSQPSPESVVSIGSPAPLEWPVTDGGKRLFASPLARKLAKEKGLDLTRVAGSGPSGRIIKADIDRLAAMPVPVQAAPAPATVPVHDHLAIAAMFEGREFEEVRLDGMRKTIAARLTEAKQTIPHFYLRRRVKLDRLLQMRSELNESIESKGIKLSINDYIIKASALALQSVPDANAVWAGDRILKLGPSDVAVAVAIEGGLYTPIIRDAHSKTVVEISAEMKSLAGRARKRVLIPADYTGGTFAISNLGMFGIEEFDAVINPPHGSILAVGTGQKIPVCNPDGTIVPASMMSVTLSVDHRVIDGALGAKFLAEIVDILENPLLMLI